MNSAHSISTHVPVLIVGGGITGLSAALFLQQQDVDFFLIERHRGTSILPRARTIDIRTMELFRSLGLGSDLREAGKALAPAWGILKGKNLVHTLEHAAPKTDAKITYPSQMASMAKLAAKSPESGCRCTQDISEVVLRKAAESGGADLRFSHELINFSQGEKLVSAIIRNRETGVDQVCTADYMFAADGANSPVRKTLNIPTGGIGSIGDFINIYFEADLAELVRGREFSQFLIAKPDLTGFLLTINNSNKWAFHLRYHPEKGQQSSDFTESVNIEVIRKVIGLPELPVIIISATPWQMTARYAMELQNGRVFLAGDSAHTMSPYVGKGANSGVQDVHNLAWKLSMVLQGKATPALLNTYSQERQPVGAFYTSLSGQLADSNGLISFDELVKHSNTLIGLPDYTYRSTAIDATLNNTETLEPMSGQPGTRIPHIWLDENHHQSTLDWFTDGFIIIANGQLDYWNNAAELVNMQLHVGLEVRQFTNQETNAAWQQITDTNVGDALLVRPDGFVAMRLTTNESAEFIVNCLQGILGN